MTSETLAFSVMAGLRCRCPACGKGPLFSGFLRLHNHCTKCGLNLGFADAGDGPAVFIMLIVGFIVTGGALLVEARYAPPYWMHAILWPPLAILLSLLLLRPLKAAMIAVQYYHQAGERRF